MTLEDLNIKLVYRRLENGLGYFDEKTGEIVINSSQSKAEQDIILIHEALHIAASGLKQMGIIKKQPDHKFITNCATQLLVIFYLAGKWNGLTDLDIKPHIDNN